MKRQKSGTTIGTKFASPYAHIFMNAAETEFLQYLQPFQWLYYIDNIFLYGLIENKNYSSFLMNLITSTLI